MSEVQPRLPLVPRPAASRREPPPARPGRRVVGWVVLFIATVLMADAIIGEKGLLDTRRARREHQALEVSLARLRHENARLREQARRLREEAGAIEAVARGELGLVRPGEVLFIVRDAPPEPRRVR